MSDITENRADRTSAKLPQEPARTPEIMGSRAYKYALWASGENKRAVGKYVRRQCAERLDIANGNDPAAFVDLKEYDRTMALLGLMIHPDLHTPMPEALEDYALLFITELFCTKAPDGRNYYTDGLLEIARKNFVSIPAHAREIIRRCAGC